MNFLLDTNVLSEPLRPEPDRLVVEWLDGVDEDRLFVSVILFAELSRGIKLLAAGRKRERLENWLDMELTERFNERIFDIDRDIALIWGDVMATTRAAGLALAPMDGFLAATCLRHDLVLVTRNEKDFAGTGVRLLNPWNRAR